MILISHGDNCDFRCPNCAVTYEVDHEDDMVCDGDTATFKYPKCGTGLALTTHILTRFGYTVKTTEKQA